jgi:hypothetical protein
MLKLVVVWKILASGPQVGCRTSKPQLLTFKCSEEDGHDKEVEAIRSLQEQARHHLRYVGGLVGGRNMTAYVMKVQIVKKG